MKEKFINNCVFPVTEDIQDLIDEGKELDNPFFLDLLGMICTNYRFFFKTTNPTKNLFMPVLIKMKQVYGESLQFSTVICYNFIKIFN